MKLFLINEITKLLLSLSLALNFILFLPIYFFNAFERYGVYTNFLLDKPEANTKFVDILNYLKFPWNISLSTDFFSPEDILHMGDVRTLFIIFFVIGLISLIIYAWLTKGQKIMYKPSKKIMIIFFTSLVLMITIIGLNFNTFFIIFHKVFFFYNDYWMLNPATSNLIKYLPEAIFLELMLILVSFTGIIYLILSLIQRYGAKVTTSKIRKT